MHIRYTLQIKASAHSLFALTQDYEQRAIWDPLTTDARLVDADQPAVGARVRCIARNGMQMDTVYVSYQPGTVAAVKMITGPAIFESFAGGWQFKELAPNLTQVKFSYSIKTKPRCLAWLLTPLVVCIFRFETRKRLKALKAHAEHLVTIASAVSR